jgi:hypothetical protein
MPDLSGTSGYIEAVFWIVIGISVTYGVVKEWLKEKWSDRSK